MYLCFMLIAILLKMWGASAWAQCGYSVGGASVTFSSLRTYHQSNDYISAKNMVKFALNPMLHYAFSSWIEKTMTKTIHYHWENRFVSH